MRNTNCKNCGAPLSYDGGLHCEYCGTWFEHPAETVLYSDGRPAYVLRETTMHDGSRVEKVDELIRECPSDWSRLHAGIVDISKLKADYIYV